MKTLEQEQENRLRLVASREKTSTMPCAAPSGRASSTSSSEPWTPKRANDTVNRLQRLVLQQPHRARVIFEVIDRFLDLSLGPRDQKTPARDYRIVVVKPGRRRPPIDVNGEW